MSTKDRSPIAEGLSVAWRHARRSVVLVVGSTVVLIGLALLILPGPAIVVIPAGLGILATEFVWARRLLRKARNEGEQMIQKFTGSDESNRDLVSAENADSQAAEPRPGELPTEKPRSTD